MSVGSIPAQRTRLGHWQKIPIPNFLRESIKTDSLGLVLLLRRDDDFCRFIAHTLPPKIWQGWMSALPLSNGIKLRSCSAPTPTKLLLLCTEKSETWDNDVGVMNTTLLARASSSSSVAIPTIAIIRYYSLGVFVLAIDYIISLA